MRFYEVRLNEGSPGIKPGAPDFRMAILGYMTDMMIVRRVRRIGCVKRPLIFILPENINPRTFFPASPK